VTLLRASEMWSEMAKAKLRFFADYAAPFPLWADDGRDPDELAEQLPLSGELVARLRDWSAAFNEHPHDEGERLLDLEWARDFEARGQALFVEVRRELGKGYAVRYLTTFTFDRRW
jgi:hypothetical protein